MTFQEVEITRFVCGPNRNTEKYGCCRSYVVLSLVVMPRIDRALKFHYVSNTYKSSRQLAPPRISSKTECVRAENWLRKSLRPAGLLIRAPKDVTVEFSSHCFLGRTGKYLNCIHFYKCFNPHSKEQHCDMRINKEFHVSYPTLWLTSTDLSSDTGPPRISHSWHACNCLFHKKKH
jgi:hypothetical protein